MGVLQRCKRLLCVGLVLWGVCGYGWGVAWGNTGQDLKAWLRDAQAPQARAGQYVGLPLVTMAYSPTQQQSFLIFLGPDRQEPELFYRAEGLISDLRVLSVGDREYLKNHAMYTGQRHANTQSIAFIKKRRPADSSGTLVVMTAFGSLDGSIAMEEKELSHNVMSYDVDSHIVGPKDSVHRFVYRVVSGERTPLKYREMEFHERYMDFRQSSETLLSENVSRHFRITPAGILLIDEPRAHALLAREQVGTLKLIPAARFDQLTGGTGAFVQQRARLVTVLMSTPVLDFRVLGSDEKIALARGKLDETFHLSHVLVRDARAYPTDMIVDSVGKVDAQQMLRRPVSHIALGSLHGHVYLVASEVGDMASPRFEFGDMFVTAPVVLNVDRNNKKAWGVTRGAPQPMVFSTTLDSSIPEQRVKVLGEPLEVNGALFFRGVILNSPHIQQTPPEERDFKTASNLVSFPVYLYPKDDIPTMGTGARQPLTYTVEKMGIGTQSGVNVADLNKFVSAPRYFLGSGVWMTLPYRAWTGGAGWRRGGVVSLVKHTHADGSLSWTAHIFDMAKRHRVLETFPHFPTGEIFESNRGYASQTPGLAYFSGNFNLRYIDRNRKYSLVLPTEPNTILLDAYVGDEHSPLSYMLMRTLKCKP